MHLSDRAAQVTAIDVTTTSSAEQSITMLQRRVCLLLGCHKESYMPQKQVSLDMNR